MSLRKEFQLSVLMLFSIRLNCFGLDSSIKFQDKMTKIMLDDIESAFKAVTKNVTGAVLRNEIIPKMYNLTHSPYILFQILSEDDESVCSMISFQRNDMMKPIFPNLTSNRMDEKLRKREQKPKTNAEIWSSLGLEGWSGELTQATDLLEVEHKDNIVMQQKSPNVNGSETIKKQILIAHSFDSPVFNRVTDNSTDVDVSDNVYIARANNPFGLSTKWIFRNESFQSTKNDRRKRGVFELYTMIKCASGCEPLSYQSYGCFCGFLGNGIAVDGIDSCCQAHDRCYARTNCVSYLQYFVPYVWKCYFGKPVCALSHGEFGGPTSCAAILCYCDARFVYGNSTAHKIRPFAEHLWRENSRTYFYKFDLLNKNFFCFIP